MKHSTKASIIRLIGLAVCIIPVAAATLSYFPVWKQRGSGELLSGFTVLLLILCIFPLIKAIKHLLRSPSIFTLWLFSFLLFMLVDSIASEMTVISFVGAVSNFIGGILFKIARKGE